MFMPGSLDKDL